MKVLFAGTPRFAVSSLSTLNKRFDVVAVLTTPDRPKGRGRGVVSSPVAEHASRLGIPILAAETVGKKAREAVAAYRPDLLVAVAFGRIFGPKFLSIFPSGGINLHPSLLPRHRGPAPIPAAILAGDAETGVTVQRLAPRMDAGAVLDQVRVSLSGRETTSTLTDVLATLGAERLAEVVARLERGSVSEIVQDESLATYCRLIEKTDGLIDWRNAAQHIDRMIRAFTPWPTAYTQYRGKRLSILTAAPRRQVGEVRTPGTVFAVDKRDGFLIQTGSGILAVEHLQLQSKKPLHFLDFLNGSPDIVGAVLGADE